MYNVARMTRSPRSIRQAAPLQRTQGAQRRVPDTRSLEKAVRKGSFVLAAAVLCAAVVLAMRHLGAALNYHDLVHAMRHTSAWAIGLALATTVLIYDTLVDTDWCAA